MDSYSPLLERTRVPQPSIQSYAVISIFEKLRSAPPHLDVNSDPGRDAITQCLNSASASVVNQSVRELCRLVKDSKLELSRGLLEIQSALEGSDPRFVGIFVKGLGFLVGLGFQMDTALLRSNSPETHSFIKILSSRTEVQSELMQQVILLMMQNQQFGMPEVCEFLKPFVNYMILRMPSSVPLSLFARNLIPSMASICSFYPTEAMPVLRLLRECIKYLPCKSAEDLVNTNYFVGCMVDAYIVVLRHLVGRGHKLVHEAQLCGMDILETQFSLCSTLRKKYCGTEAVLEVSRRVLVAQKDLGLSYIPELSSVILSLFYILIHSDVEHEQLLILKLLLFILKWKNESEFDGGYGVDEELLFIFPVISLVSSPSISLKQAATSILSVLEKLSVNILNTPKPKPKKQVGFPVISRPEHITFRLLQNLWFQDQSSSHYSPYIHFTSASEVTSIDTENSSKSHISILREFSQQVVEKRKSLLPISRPQEIFINEMPPILGAIASVLVIHRKLGSSAVDLLAVTGNMDPKLGVSLLLVVLFYNNILCGKNEVSDFHGMSLKLLGMLPSLASHSAMMPLVGQTILQMLHKDTHSVLYSTAIRLLCKTWEINDRVFGSLEGVLHPKEFSEVTLDRTRSISLAASVRDVCQKNPDRGVDLILSVSACVENKDPIVQALGLHSLAYLCEADVLDFYTAWAVMAKHVSGYSTNPVIAHSTCLLLRWGAMDAEAYPEASLDILQILWEIGLSKHPDHRSMWARPRASAFESLSHYDVLYIQKSIPDFREKNVELLTSEMDPEVLRAIESFEVKIITYEHITRRRVVKEKRVAGNKIEKLLDVLPQVLFSGNDNGARDLPGAALFFKSFTSKNVNKQGAKKELEDLHHEYETAVVEIASSLTLSRNIQIALLSLQSWKPFMQRWMRASIMLLDAKAPTTVLDKTSKVANNILKSLLRIAEESIPRCAENIALAMGALCMIIPPSAHAIKSAASKFLLNWIFEYEHEYQQWSAAIALGAISSCLHVTDHKEKLQNINALLEVAFVSKSTLVKGACGVGLGFSCQDLLTRVQAEDNSPLDKETYKKQELNLLGKIVRGLCQLLSQYTQSSFDTLQSLSECFPLAANETDIGMTNEPLSLTNDDLEEDIWGVAGLVLGLTNTVSAIYRAGAHDAVTIVKDIVISWIPHASSSIQKKDMSEKHEIVLSVGSCLALPTVIAFCQRVELVSDVDMDHLVNGYKHLISELVSVKKTGILHQSLLMSSCIGAGNLIACILNEGVYSMEHERLKDFMTLFKKTYSNPHPRLVYLGGMLGIVNALGAHAGILFQQSLFTPTALHNAHEQKDSFPDSTSSIQEIFLVAKDPDDQQLQHYAAWAISFLRHSLFVREVRNEDSKVPNDGSNSVSQSFPEDSLVMKLSLWLTHLNHHGTGTISHVNTVATLLRCLSQAPRLPNLDWGAIIRRCMRYEDQVSNIFPSDSTLKKGILRENCILFSLAHANQFDSLLIFLDELSELSRFSKLELNLQSCILMHLSDLTNIFSGSRLVKLYNDVMNFIYGLVSLDQVYNAEERSLLHVSCWKGIHNCLDETSLDSQEYVANVKDCMEALFSLLPEANVIENQEYLSKEWSEAIRCLGKASKEWLINLLQVNEVEFSQGKAHLREIKKKIQAKARLVRIGSLPIAELGKLKSYMLNTSSEGIWDILVEISASLQHAEGSVKRQWVVDAVEISCVTSYPCSAIQFLGLLCGSFSKYMPLLTIDHTSVLSDLPVTLTSLLSETSWGEITESVVSYLYTCMERIDNWATLSATTNADDSQHANLRQPIIEKSEANRALFVLQVLHHTCVVLKDYLTLDKQIRLANISFPSTQPL